MALRLAFSHPAFGTYTEAYWLIRKPVFDKLEHSVSFSLVGFRDQATRAAHKAALADYLAKLQARIVKQQALEALKPVAGDTAEDIAVKEIKSDPARVEFSQAQVAERLAAHALGKISPVAEQTINIQPQDVDGVLTDGEVDVAKLYTQLVKVPQFAAAERVD